jgi:hypothetical protein
VQSGVSTTETVLSDATPSRVPKLRRLAVSAKKSGVLPLQIYKDLINGTFHDRGRSQFFDALPSEERDYWLASLYALLMPTDRRKLSAYFTPPHLAKHALKVRALRALPLPPHSQVKVAFAGSKDDDQAADTAYALTTKAANAWPFSPAVGEAQ